MKERGKQIMKNKLIILTLFFTTACSGDEFSTYGPGDIRGSYDLDGEPDTTEEESAGDDLLDSTGGTSEVVGTGGADVVGTGGASVGGTTSTGGEVSTGGDVSTGGNVGNFDPCAIIVSDPVGVANCSFGGVDDFEDTTNGVCGQNLFGQWEIVGNPSFDLQYLALRDTSLKGARIHKFANEAGEFGIKWRSRSEDKSALVPIYASMFDGISFYAKMNHNTQANVVSLGINTADNLEEWDGGDCSDHCSERLIADVVIMSDWKKYHVPFCALHQEGSDLELDPSAILQLEFVARSNGGIQHDFTIDDIYFE